MWPAWPIVATLISLLSISKCFYTYLHKFERKNLMIWKMFALYSVPVLLFTDVIIRVSCGISWISMTHFVSLPMVLLLNWSISCVFAAFLADSKPKIFFFIYALTMPITCATSLMTLLLNLPDGWIFFLEYLLRITANIAFFSLTCWDQRIEKPLNWLVMGTLVINALAWIVLCWGISGEFLRSDANH